MNISLIEGEGYGYRTFSEAADIVIGNARVDKPTRVRILTGSTVLVDNDYYGDPAGEIHLDIREVVRNHTWLPVPGLFADGNGIPRMVFAPSPAMDGNTEEVYDNGVFTHVPVNPGLRFEHGGRLPVLIEVTRYGSEPVDHTAIVFLCDKFIARDWRETEEFVPDIDDLQVPEDYLLPMAMFNLYKGENAEGRYGRVELISANGERTYDAVILDSSEYEACLATQLVKVSDIPHEAEAPFYLRVISYTSDTGDPGSGVPHVINTPRFRVVGKKMEQYAFLSPEGLYYNIPMSGILRHIPEYDITVLKKSVGFEKTYGFVSDLHEQNSGPLTRKTALSLSRYLCSEMVYYYDPDSALFRRIIIENPSVSISNAGGVYSLTFQWRYEDNDNYYNY